MKMNAVVCLLVVTVSFAAAVDSRIPTRHACELAITPLDPVDFVNRALGGSPTCVDAENKEECCETVKGLFGPSGPAAFCLCNRDFFSSLLFGLPTANGVQPDSYSDMLAGCDLPVAGQLSCPGTTEETPFEPVVQAQFGGVLAKILGRASAPATPPPPPPRPPPPPSTPTPTPPTPTAVPGGVPGHYAGHHKGYSAGYVATPVQYVTVAPAQVVTTAPATVVEVDTTTTPSAPPQQIIIEEPYPVETPEEPADSPKEPAASPVEVPEEPAEVPATPPTETGSAQEPTEVTPPPEEPAASPVEIPEEPAEVPAAPVPETGSTQEPTEVTPPPEEPAASPVEIPEEPAEVPAAPVTETGSTQEPTEVTPPPEEPAASPVEIPEEPAEVPAAPVTETGSTQEVTPPPEEPEEAQAVPQPEAPQAPAEASPPEVAPVDPEVPEPVPIEPETPEPGPICKSVLDIVAETPELSTLLKLVQVAGLSGSLGADFTGTIFAPNDAAFSNLLAELGLDLNVLLDARSKDLVSKILQLHVAAGTALKSTDLTDGQTITTLLGAEEVVEVSVADGVTVQGPGNTKAASVVSADIEACSAVVHITSEVLIPSPKVTASSGP